MRITIRGALALPAAAILLVALLGCNDSGEGGGITLWTLEDVTDRVGTQERIVAEFRAKTGIPVEVVPVAENEFNNRLTSAAAANALPDVIAAIPLAAVRTMQADELLDTDTPRAVVDALGRDTFTPAALDLVSDGGTLLAVPSDAWRLLLIYRKDLLKAANLPVPNTYEKLARAAAALDNGDRVGFVAGTDPSDAFTQQSFEFFALANGCELADDGGDVKLDSTACDEAFGAYAGIMREHSVAGNQTFESARANYFAGNAAMILWSSFLLDEMAGLRDDARPPCPECRSDPAFLAKNSGVVTGFIGPSGHKPTSFGEVSSWVVTANAETTEARRLIEYMMSDGYLSWLAMAPEGKIPTRAGTKDAPRRYADAWRRLSTGVDIKSPLSRFYDQSFIDAVAANPGAVDRWGLRQGQGELVGAIQGQAPVAKSLNKLITSGGVPSEASQEADQAVETIKRELD